MELDSGNTAWVLISTALVLFMTPGLALFYGGMVRSKNVLGMLMQNIFAMGLLAVLWAALVFSLAFGNAGDGGFIGNFDYVWLKDVGPGLTDQEFLGFLQQVAAAYPRRELHVVVDNYATHKHPAVRAWLARHPRVHLHFTPTSGSWLNLVEAFFSIITRQALRRGNFPTVTDLIAAIECFIAAWNDRCRPFTWTKDPDTVIDKATHPRNRKTQQTSDTEH